MKKVRQLTLTNDEGQEVLCHVLMAFENDGKNYALFYSKEGAEIVDGEEKFPVMAAKYVATSEGIDLDNIEEEEEWKLVEENFMKQQQGQEFADYILWGEGELEEDECGGECDCCSGCHHEECDCDDDCDCHHGEHDHDCCHKN